MDKERMIGRMVAIGKDKNKRKTQTRKDKGKKRMEGIRHVTETVLNCNITPLSRSGP